MLVDIFCNTNILSEWMVVWLGLPILAHSGANPWIYAFHHGEMRIAAGKIAQDLVALFGVMPGHYGCSPTRCGTNTNLELAEVNYDEESNESRRHPPIEDCFTATKHHKALYKNRCLEISGRHIDISPEKHDIEHIASCSSRPGDIIEENIHDLTKMLEPRYIIDRNHVIDSNHNIDKIKNLKYLLDPTFNKIRHLRRLNHKRINGNNLPLIFKSEKFISYQNLKSNGSHSNRKFLRLNALSDPILNVDTSVVDTNNSNQVMCRVNNVAYQRRNSNLIVSDSNLGAATVHASEVDTRLFPISDISDNDTERHDYSVQNLNQGHEDALARHAMMLCRQMEDQQREAFSKASSRPRPKFRHFGRVNPNLKHRLRSTGCSFSSSALNNVRTSCETDILKRSVLPHLTITSNKLANLINLDSPSRNACTPAHIINFTAKTMTQTHRNLEALKHSESINAIGDPVMHRVTLLEPSNLMDSLVVPTIHSEPPSPIDPLPAASLQPEETQSLEIPRSVVDVFAQRAGSPLSKRSNRKPIPIVPTVLLNIEDLSESFEGDDQILSQRTDPPSGNTSTLEPIDLFEALLRNSDKGRDTGLPESIFAEHDSTRFSSRRPSDSKWSESSRSQEVLSSAAMEHQTAFPLSYSVNDFQTCNSDSDLNDLTSLDPFMCPDALTSSLRESFFSAPSMPDSDIFTSFEESYEPVFTPDSERDALAYSSMSTINLKRCAVEATFQSRSTESVHRVRHPSTRSCTILRVEPAVHSNRLRIRPCADYILKDSPPVKRNPRLAPLAIPTPTDICTPTFDIVSEIKSDNGIGVRV